MNIKKFIRDITGFTALEEERIQIEKINEELKQKKREESIKRKEQRKKLAESKLTPKELATKKNEPWVDVIDFKINQDDIRNGFFELDWNDQFIVKLKNEGYGFDGDPDEEIVERWYRDICKHVAAEEGIVMEHRTAGNLGLNIRKLPDNKSEIG